MTIPPKIWRLNNLYRIIDKNGNSIPFHLNKVQEHFIADTHNRKICLKARQLGMSTASVLDMLDDTIFTPNLAAGVVSYSLEHAQHIFKRIIGHALDTWLKEYKPLLSIVNRSAREITFGNGSVLRVDTTLRGGTYPHVLVSEFGKTCARNPNKAEEVITGTLNSVPVNGKIVIESTGEGNEGFFAEMVQQANLRGHEDLSPLEYKLFFYSWMWEKSYQMEEKVLYPVELTDYFDKIEQAQEIKIHPHQRNWYAAQWKFMHEKVKQEYPSTIGEAFLASSDAYYFAQGIEEAYNGNRCLYSPLYDSLLPVYVAMDIGINDLTVMVFFQLAHGEIRVIDYYEDNNKGVDFYAKYLLQDRPYLYHTIFLPHDAAKRDQITAQNTYERDFRRLFSSTSTRFHVLKRVDKQLQISHAKSKLARCVFNLSKVKPFLDKVSKYRKKWHEPTGRYLEEPLHDINCFVGETLIETEHGKKRIDLIKEGEKVLTPNGYKKVTKVFVYRTNNLVSVSFKGQKVICTPHHKFFTKEGLVTADALRYDSHIISQGEKKIWEHIACRGREKKLGFKGFFLSMSQEQLSSLMDVSSRKISLGIIWAMVHRFKEKFGSIIKEKFQKNTIYTILMATNQTIQLRICNLFPTQSICECTCLPKSVRRCQEAPLEKQLKLQRNGIDLKKVENGIQNMEKKYLKTESIFIKNALTVKTFLRLFKNSANIALQRASRIIEGSLEKITKKENVKSAMLNSHAISTQSKWPAQLHVGQCLGIEKEVYDLTVDEDHCYFANGLLVSNSNYADCLQYMCAAVSHLETVSSLGGALDAHRRAVENRAKRVI